MQNSATKHATGDHEKVVAMRRAYEKRVNDKWRRALRHLSINDNLFPNHKDDIEKQYPFNLYNVWRICEGAFN